MYNIHDFYIWGGGGGGDVNPVALKMAKTGVLAILSATVLTDLSHLSHLEHRLAPVLKTIFQQCAISYTCNWSYSDGSVLKHVSARSQSLRFILSVRMNSSFITSGLACSSGSSKMRN